MAPVFHKTQQRRRRLRNSLLLLGVLLIVFFAIVGYRTYRVYQSDLPSFEQLHNIEPSLKTRVYDRNGILLKEIYSENRVLTPYDDMPEHLINMLVATEDRAYYRHWGLDLRRIAIVAATNLVQMEVSAGASTITQQLARMLFLNREVSLERKAKEALTAIKLERNYSKEEILEMYLNQYYFSRGCYGVAAASRLFFSKEPREMSISECAILIGMLKAPNTNSPMNNPDKSLAARNRVLYSYRDWGGITQAQYDSLKEQPLELNPPEEKVGVAPYFTETVRQYILEKYGEETLYSGGLKVYTSVDIDLQRAADSAVSKKVDSLRARIERLYPKDDPNYTYMLPDTTDEFGFPIREYKKVQGAFVAIDNENGDVLAMVGGRDFQETKFNRANQALRQPGSCFKPFVYTACVDNGYRTTTIVDDNPIVLDIPGAKQWRPHNFDDKFMGPITLRDGLKHSRNLIAIRLLMNINPSQAIFYARKMGITTPLADVYSLAIGVSEVKLIEMVSAFSVFPNQGIRIPYRYVHKIIDRYGRVLEDNTAVQKEEVLSAQTAFIMADMMQSVVKEGTGRRSQWMGFTRPAGGKTGTSDNFCDNWFIGYTPQITAGTWVGFDDKTSLGRNQDGAKNGVPIWTEFMISAHDTIPIAGFEEPDGIVHLEVCLESGEIATDQCTDVRKEVFTVDNQPTALCTIHPSKGGYLSERRRENQAADTSSERTRF